MASLVSPATTRCADGARKNTTSTAPFTTILRTASMGRSCCSELAVRAHSEEWSPISPVNNGLLMQVISGLALHSVALHSATPSIPDTQRARTQRLARFIRRGDLLRLNLAQRLDSSCRQSAVDLMGQGEQCHQPAAGPVVVTLIFICGCLILHQEAEQCLLGQKTLSSVHDGGFQFGHHWPGPSKSVWLTEAPAGTDSGAARHTIRPSSARASSFA